MVIENSSGFAIL